MPTGRPDWFGTIVAAGKYDTTYIPIALDVDGFITATMKGKYDTDAVLKTIAVDSSGVMKANVSVQDLDFLTVRPAYGRTQAAWETVLVPDSTWTRLRLISGRGVTLGGIIYWSHTSTRRDVDIDIIIDGVSVRPFSVKDLYDFSMFEARAGPLYLLEYDDDNFSYFIGLTWGMTFESSIEIKAYHEYGSSYNVSYQLYWALVP